MKLNIDAIQSAMRFRGLSQADISKRLSVSREAVSKWLRREAVPRPGRVIRLANLLGLAFDQIYEADAVAEPVVAFRKKGSAKTREHHLERARDMALLLQNLVPYLPFDLLSHPASFIEPKTDSDYIVKAAAEIRSHMSLRSSVVDFRDIINFFGAVHSVLIPVMWGKRGQHENALHVYLPDSRTTWVYLNIDTKIMDFKFWMAHELAHVKAPTLPLEEAERFADRFAAELLYPLSIAEEHYEAVLRCRSSGQAVTIIQQIATEFVISPITVVSQLNLVAAFRGTRRLDINVHPSTTNFNKSFPDVNEILFGTEQPAPGDYLRTAREEFRTPFFDALYAYLAEANKEASFVQRVLNISPLDAKGLYRALMDERPDPA